MFVALRYTSFALPANAKDANLTPTDALDPLACGWTRVASVDTRQAKENSELSSAPYEVSILAAEDDLQAFAICYSTCT